MKRPIFIFAVACFVLTDICFNFRKLSFIITLSLVLIIPVFIYYGKLKYIIPLLLCVAVMVNMLASYSEIDRIKLISKGSVTEDFIVTDCDITDGDYQIYRLKTLSGNTIPKDTLTSAALGNDIIFSTGDVYNITVKLSDIPKTQRQYYYGEGIYFSSHIISVNQKKKSDTLYKVLGNIREHIINTDYEFLKGDTAATLVAVTLGKKSYLSDELYDAVRIDGVSHMMAVSGLHLTIVLGSFVALIGYFISNKYLKLVLVILATALLMGICGFSKSILRAGFMYGFAALAPIFKRKSDGLCSLGTAIFVILLLSPFASQSIALKLSAIASFAIIYISPNYKSLVAKALKIKGKFLNWLLDTVVTTVTVCIFTMPLIIKYFSFVSLVSVLANLLLYYPLYAALLLNSVVVVIPVFLIPLRALVLKCAGLCSDVMIIIIKALSKLPFASVKLGNTAFYISTAVALSLIVATDILRYYKKYKRKG